MSVPASVMDSPVTAPEPAAAGKLINIDNGGTLTDICVIDGATVYRTKTVTTPYDLSKCLFEGLKKASRVVYGEEDVQRLLLSTEYIRYSTTQGTNALVERKGPRLGLILGGGLEMQSLQTDAQAEALFAALVGERVQHLAPSLSGDALDVAVTRAVTALASAGANRIVVAYGGADRKAGEAGLKRLLLRRFPPHMLGALPVLYSHELVDDADDARRTWTALFNAFLHPAMERFLYSAEHRLRDYKTRNPLLIFRNDGNAARVARTSAIKTYSSGPRGGAEGVKALAAHYALNHLLSMDVGGTTTDIGEVDRGSVRLKSRGQVEGIESSFSLCDVVSVGVGGSSIIRADGKRIKVGPDSVGGAPGPACFGLGGKDATITDAFLLQGLLDPASFFGGELKIDVERARAAIAEKVAGPHGVSEEQAAQDMEAAWVAKVADSLKAYTQVRADTTLAAFGGAGPFVACKVAEAAGISRVIIPGLAAVFSAFGIGFSDIGHTYEQALSTADAAGLAEAHDALQQQAQRGMFAEGMSLRHCQQHLRLTVSTAAGEQSLPLEALELPSDLPSGAHLVLQLEVVKSIAHAEISGRFGGATQAAVSNGTRRTVCGGQWQDLPLYRIEDQPPGVSAEGPCVLEEAFFTARVEAGWRFEINEAGDILLSRAGQGV